MLVLTHFIFTFCCLTAIHFVQAGACVYWNYAHILKLSVDCSIRPRYLWESPSRLLEGGVKDASASIDSIPYWPMTGFTFLCLNFFSYTFFARHVWPPFLSLFEFLTVVRHNCIILWFVYERILLRFVYFVMNSHLFCYSTAIKSTLVPFVLTRDQNIMRWLICCFCWSLAVRKHP